MNDWQGLARTLGFADEASMLHYFYIEEELPIKDISLKLQCGPATIRARLEKHRIETRSRGGANSTQRVSKKLYRMDQRRVFMTSNNDLALIVSAHSSTVYKYKREVTGGYKPWISVQ